MDIAFHGIFRQRMPIGHVILVCLKFAHHTQIGKRLVHNADDIGHLSAFLAHLYFAHSVHCGQHLFHNAAGLFGTVVLRLLHRKIFRIDPEVEQRTMIGITPRLIEKIRFHTVICKPVCVIQKAAEAAPPMRTLRTRIFAGFSMRILCATTSNSTNSAVASTTWLSGVMA